MSAGIVAAIKRVDSSLSAARFVSAQYGRKLPTHLQGEASPPVSTGFAAAAKRAGSSLASEGPEPDTPFYRGLKVILGRSGRDSAPIF